MNLQILSRPFLKESCDLLKEQLSLRGVRASIIHDARDITGDYMRYGNSSIKVPSSDKNVVGNSGNFIRLSRDKYSTVQVLQQVISDLPTFYTFEPHAADYPVVVRTTLTSYGGDGIVVCKNRKEYLKYKGHFWTKYIYTNKEYRVHILGGKIVKLFEKVSEYETEFPIRVSTNGYHYKLIDHSKYKGLKKFCDTIHQQLAPYGGDMYSLDVGYINSRSKYFLFEVNSASGLNSKTAALYADYIVKKLCAK